MEVVYISESQSKCSGLDPEETRREDGDRETLRLIGREQREGGKKLKGNKRFLRRVI
ncbi:hypothetical protein CHS0354_036315 [Potamilus streckersoni]|uniref:Uncharacterized protein n=1 Tax=Potamilus streckersoni TaxID=2493646 RepID=A0AAE0T7R5_9BIVA|nr:hypothetical protein CHS0354_036315 [Potamilus streckersoni]